MSIYEKQLNSKDKAIKIEMVKEVDEYLREIMLLIDEEAFGLGSLNHWSLPPFLHYGRIYLARYYGKPVGVAELMRDWRDPCLAYLYGYAVAQEYSGKGIGTTMLRHILEALPRSGFTRLQIVVQPENKAALHICEEKFRMKRVEFLENYYGPGEGRWLLEWSWQW